MRCHAQRAHQVSELLCLLITYPATKASANTHMVSPCRSSHPADVALSRARGVPWSWPASWSSRSLGDLVGPGRLCGQPQSHVGAEGLLWPRTQRTHTAGSPEGMPCSFAASGLSGPGSSQDYAGRSRGLCTRGIGQRTRPGSDSQGSSRRYVPWGSRRSSSAAWASMSASCDRVS